MAILSALYDAVLIIAFETIGVLSPFLGQKIRAGHFGKKNWKSSIKKSTQGQIWFHLASLGEYEQALPIIRHCEKTFGTQSITITFFSPSGFEQVSAKKEDHQILYLPLDTRKNARTFFRLVQPRLCIFTKYDLWYNHLLEAEKRRIPTILIAAHFSPDKFYFQWYGRWMKKRLQNMTYIFTQDTHSTAIAQQHDLSNVQLGGDPRIERSASLPNEPFFDPKIAAFTKGKKVLILGSTHPEDTRLLLSHLVSLLDHTWAVIIAPHEIDQRNIEKIKRQLPSWTTSTYTHFEMRSSPQWLILNIIGILKYTYRYADAVYIGGGFDQGIHNVLEPASYGVKLAYGPRHTKFPEAVALIKTHGALLISRHHTARDMATFLKMEDKDTMAKRQLDFFEKNIQASQEIKNWITKFARS